MANKKKEVYHVKPLNENKKNIIAALIEGIKYNIFRKLKKDKKRDMVCRTLVE